MSSTDLAVTRFELDQRRAKAYAESGYWPDAQSVAQAVVKIEAGRELGIPAFQAMSEIHVIKGRPSIGAGALASQVKTSGRYDYRLVELTNDRAVIRFYDRGQRLTPDSVFTHEDAVTAELPKRNPNYQLFPRNMLFARAMSNGVAWHCPDVTSGRVYTIDELDDTAFPDDIGELEIASVAADEPEGEPITGASDSTAQTPTPSDTNEPVFVAPAGVQTPLEADE